jgi:hypothetical protein
MNYFQPTKCLKLKQALARKKFYFVVLIKNSTFLLIYYKKNALLSWALPITALLNFVYSNLLAHFALPTFTSYLRSPPFMTPINSPERNTNFKDLYGNASITTENSQVTHSFDHDLTHASFFDNSKQHNWQSLSQKIFVADALIEANIAGADVSDFRFKINNPDDPQWQSLKQHIDTTEKVVTGGEINNPPTEGDSPYHNTIDLSVLLLKGTDDLIVSTMASSFYSDGTTFHADAGLNAQIHERLLAVSSDATGQNPADIVSAAKNYKDMRQESAPINLDNADAINLADETFGNGQGTIRPTFELTEELRNQGSSVDYETFERAKDAAAVKTLTNYDNALVSINKKLSDGTIDATTAQQQIAGITGNNNATADITNERFDIFINADVCYPKVAVEESLPSDVKKELGRTGVRVSDTPVEMNNLKVVGFLSNTNLIKLDGGSTNVEMVVNGTGKDFFIAQDVSIKDGPKFFVPVDEDSCIENRRVVAHKSVKDRLSEALNRLEAIFSDKLGERLNYSNIASTHSSDTSLQRRINEPKENLYEPTTVLL